MKFDKDTAAAVGRKGGTNRWRSKDPSTKRDRLLSLAVSCAEQEMIEVKAKDVGLSRTELIVRAVREYRAN